MVPLTFGTPPDPRPRALEETVNCQPGVHTPRARVTCGETDGCMLELTWRGAHPIALPDGESRKWLEDGDTLTLSGFAQGDGYRVGFGEVTGRVVS